MPKLQTTSVTSPNSEPIAILVSDLHIRSTVPSARTETDWYEVMAAAFAALKKVASKHKVPIICAGDVVDKWNSSGELVSWAIDHVPTMYAIPGQHCLLGHDLSNKLRGAYGALVKSGVLIDMEPEQWTTITPGKLSAYAMPWGRYLGPSDIPDRGVRLLVIHKYLYYDQRTCYQGAPEEGSYERHKDLFSPFDAVLAGDNHIPWLVHATGRSIYNHGGFIPQNKDQKNLTPSVGVLYENGRISLEELEVPPPLWQEAQVVETGPDYSGVAKAIADMRNTGPDFSERLLRAAENAASDEVRKIVREVWEKTRK